MALVVETVIALVLLVVIIVAIATPIRRRQLAQLRTVQRQYPGSLAWLAVAEGRSHDSILLVGDHEVLLTRLDGQVEHVWPRSAVTRATLVQIRQRALNRPGLRLDFGNATQPSSVGLIFTNNLGLTASATIALNVRDLCRPSGISN